MLIRQKESELLTKLANMLRAEERRPKSKRDHELIAAINQTMEDLKRQRKQRGQRGRDSPEDLRLQRPLPAGFIAPCLPTKTDKLPSGSQWLHEIKHDGFRIIARKDGP